jgi:Flp pilus assembly protein TadG
VLSPTADVTSLLHATQATLTKVFANNPRELQVVNQQFNSMLVSVQSTVSQVAMAPRGFLQVVQGPGTVDYRVNTNAISPQTQMVLGIITNMLESFEARLAEVETKRVNDKTEFTGLKDTK